MSGFSTNPAHVRLDVHQPTGEWLQTFALDMTGHNDTLTAREAVEDAIRGQIPYSLGDYLFVVHAPRHRDPLPVVITPDTGTESDAITSRDRRIQALQELAASLNLYVGHHTWTQLTTQQKELFADAVDADRARSGDDDGYRTERWWRD